MIAKELRFHGYGSLRFVYTKGQTVRTRYLSLKYAPNTHRSKSRLAVVVSKKISKKAPVRNHIRRRLYEEMRLQWPTIETAHDMVISVFDERVGTVAHTDLSRMVTDLLKQAKLT